MRYFLRDVSVEIAGFLFIRVGLRPSILNEIIVDPIFERNRVSNCRLFALVNGIEHFKDLSSNKLIIAINKEADLVGFAVFGYGHMDVRYCSHLFFIGD